MNHQFKENRIFITIWIKIKEQTIFIKIEIIIIKILVLSVGLNLNHHLLDLKIYFLKEIMIKKNLI